MDAIIDYRGKTPRKVSAGVPLITAKIVKNGVIEEPTEFVADAEYNSWMRRGLPQAGDVLLTTEAPLGEVAQLKSSRVALAQRIILLRGKRGVLDNTYLSFLLQSEEVRSQLLSRSSGTTVSGIKQSELRKVRLLLPPLDEQEVIAETLGCLSAAIQAKLDANKTLESVTRMIFKSWFVDFDPVRAKTEGREPEGMDAATADLFPDFIQESELGDLPLGWSVRNLGDTLKIAYGKNLPTSRLTAKGYPVFGGNGVIGFHGEYLYESRQVLVACRGAASGKVNQTYPRAFVTNNSLVLESNNESPLRFGYLKGLMMNSDLTQFVTGSAQPQVTIENLRRMRLIVPPTTLVNHFEAISGAIEDRIEALVSHCGVLIELRDTLLPRLISGKLRVPEAEKLVREIL